jgi:uncharacterized protein (DUF1810 family)
VSLNPVSTKPGPAQGDPFSFRYPDDLKFQSCPTLFMNATAGDKVFNDARLKYFHGKPDQPAIELLAQQTS